MHTCFAKISRRPFASVAILLLASVAGTAALATEGSASHDKTAGHDKAGHDANKKPTHWYQIGRASWYGRGFQGHRTASGEAFDLNMLTCAHPTLPIGTLLRVTNLMNRRSIMVRVNDRGPVEQGRIVDLTFAAARALGVAGRGTMRVRLEKVEGAEAAQLNWPDLGPPRNLDAYLGIYRSGSR